MSIGLQHRPMTNTNSPALSSINCQNVIATTMQKSIMQKPVQKNSVTITRTSCNSLTWSPKTWL